MASISDFVAKIRAAIYGRDVRESIASSIEARRTAMLKIYDEKTRMYPSGKIATPERVYADYPAMKTFTHVITTDESDEVILSINNLSMMRSRYGIDASLSEEEAVVAIQEAMDAAAQEQAQAETVKSPEERSAEALEAIAAGQTTENAAALNVLLTGEEVQS